MDIVMSMFKTAVSLQAATPGRASWNFVKLHASYWPACLLSAPVSAPPLRLTTEDMLLATSCWPPCCCQRPSSQRPRRGLSFIRRRTMSSRIVMPGVTGMRRAMMHGGTAATGTMAGTATTADCCPLDRSMIRKHLSRFPYRKQQILGREAGRRAHRTQSAFFAANSRTSCVIFIEQKRGPHIEQK